MRIKDAHRLVVRHDEDYGGPLRSLDNNVSSFFNADLYLKVLGRDYVA